MTQCQNTMQSRKIFCNNKPKNADDAQIGWAENGKNRRFLQLSEDSRLPSYAISISVKRNNCQLWKSHQLCDDVTHYEGCYRFTDGSFLAYLEMEESGPKMTKINISAPIFIENSDCEVSKSIDYTFDGNYWGRLDGAPFVLQFKKPGYN